MVVAWIDIGMAAKSDFEYDFIHNKSVHLFGMEPTLEYYSSITQRLKNNNDRLTIFNKACVGEKDPPIITFNKHPLQECNSILAANEYMYW
jgi:hypothetical protein